MYRLFSYSSLDREKRRNCVLCTVPSFCDYSILMNEMVCRFVRESRRILVAESDIFLRNCASVYIVSEKR